MFLKNSVLQHFSEFSKINFLSWSMTFSSGLKSKIVDPRWWASNVTSFSLNMSITELTTEKP